MKHVRGVKQVIAFLGLVLMIVAQVGCATGGATYSGANGGSMADDGRIDTTYRQGDKIIIDFADNPSIPPSWPQTVREDGTITLPFNQTLIAADKKKGELEQEIHKLYVPRLLRRLTVNVRAEERSYFVRGEVKNPGQKPHTGSITALKAVSAAGDFTDFANRRKIEIIRANGQKFEMNGKQALADPSKDVPVYPGDTVYVHRRFF
jgi:protein involved in polysaccharide export with SLBB domain